MRWGLVPPWAKTGADGGPDTKGPLLINARAETVTTSPAFRASAKGKRCLVPMDGWYEWKPNGENASGKKAAKTPYYMYGADGELLFMGGLWSTWRPAKDSGAPSDMTPLLSCTIITTESAGPLSEIHDRMPLTISERDWDRWLDPDAPIDEGLLRGHGDLDRIAIREVSRLVNSVRNNGPELIEPAERLAVTTTYGASKAIRSASSKCAAKAASNAETSRSRASPTCRNTLTCIGDSVVTKAIADASESKRHVKGPVAMSTSSKSADNLSAIVAGSPH
jgi:putative SOS response-associated peptidase YedK